MSLDWYQCKKCETLLKNTVSPRSNGCPSGGQHDWNRLGEVGNTDYLCKKCSTHIQTDKSPRSNGCLKGGQHDWKRLK